MKNILSNINIILWGFPMICLLLGIHIYFSIKLKFVQKKIFKAIQLSFSNTNTKETSALSTLTTMLAATLGTGNIIGVSTSIALGGPGAIFWCWLTGLLGMATSYAECYLGIYYRIRKNNNYYGGPMYVLEKGLSNKPLAIIFCFCTIFASYGVGCTTQSSSISNSLKNLINISPSITGFVCAIICGFIIIGGFSSISKVCLKLVPSMSIFYILGCSYILIIHRTYILSALVLIIKSAFTSNAFFGGVVGFNVKNAIRYGVSRGLFTNEAGLGSAPITASMANSHSIKEQSLISMTATFLDTVIMCAITGLTIVSTFLANNISLHNIPSTELVLTAFNTIPYIGTSFLSISLTAFAFATLIGWYSFGEKSFEYIFGLKYLNIYKISYIVMIYVGTVMSLDMIWEMCDLFNALMALPNIYSLYMLRQKIN